MRILKDSVEIHKEIKRLLRTYLKYYWAVAWASSSSDLSTILLKNKHRIQKMIVGIHFYQTHPDFIKHFKSCENVRFVMNPNGVFHPKLYFFEDDTGNWECVIGSPNFTEAAFKNNTEVAVLISSHDSGNSNVRKDILKNIDTYWEQAKLLDNDEIESYENVWRRKRKLLNQISGNYTSRLNKRALKSPLEVDIFKMAWKDFFLQTKADKHHSLKGRILVLKTARNLFESQNQFNKMNLKSRQGIAGFGKQNEIPWAWFGSMKGAGYFKKTVNENNEYISLALDQIPLIGDITENHYLAFKELFLKAFDSGGSGVATATRLLAMKRPDYFVCFDSQNREQLCKAFEIPKNINLSNYWLTIVERIIDSVWWNSEKPSADQEFEVWKGRTAFLDSLFYEPAV